MLKIATKLKNCAIDTRVRQNITRLRRERGMSIQDLARLSGVPYLSRIEHGSKAIGKQGLIKLAQALNVDIAELYRPDRSNRADQLVQVFEQLSAEGQSLLLETAKSIAAYEMRLKWRE